MMWLKDLRLQQGKTQQEISIACGINRSYYANIEAGRRGKHLPAHLAKRIAIALNFDWTRFYEEEKDAG